MILVTGSVLGREDTINELLELSREHVQRSLTEPGCLAHGVYIDAENPLRLVFVEQWQDRESLGLHFRVPASGEFVTHLRRLAAEPPNLNVYDAMPIDM